MKARLFKKLMGEDCGYYPNDNREYIALGSPLCHNLFSVNKKTLEVKYALDTFNEGRKTLEKRGNENLLKIWDRLHELVQSGEILEVINGVDEIENPIIIWTINEGELVETHTDKIGWPNTTYDGKTMYEDTYFTSKEEAIKYGIKEYRAGARIMRDSVERKSKELIDAHELLNQYESWVRKFENMANGDC